VAVATLKRPKEIRPRTNRLSPGASLPTERAEPDQTRYVARRLVLGALATRELDAILLRKQAACLAYLAEDGQVRRLGFASLGDLASEMLGMRPRTARERVALHRSFVACPIAERAFLQGRLTSCKVTALAPVLNREDASAWMRLDRAGTGHGSSRDPPSCAGGKAGH